MVQTALIGIAAGVAAALLFASVATGSLASVLLFYLAPLPLMIAAIGWTHLAGLVAAVTAAAGLAAVFGWFFFIAFLLGIGLPAWWLGYLALLARPATPHAPDGLDWYPIGRIVIWAALIGAAVVIIAIPNVGTDAETFRAGLRRVFERVLRVQTGEATDAPLQLPGVNDPGRLLDILVAAVPPMAAVLSTLTSLVNLWLAGIIVKVSGRLKRPWPQLSAIAFPNTIPFVLAAALAATVLPDLLGVVAGVLAASLMMAYALLGLAVMHAITLRVNGRTFVLTGMYVALGMFGWPVLMMTLLGLIDTIFSIRARVARRRGPPPRSV